jgi:hypothetical protein
MARSGEPSEEEEEEANEHMKTVYPLISTGTICVY